MLRTKLYLNHKHSSFVLDVDLSMPGNGVTAVYGPSGSGKTTLLRCLAGLEDSACGQVVVNGETWLEDFSSVKAHKRPLGYVFQSQSLLPHLSLRQNLDFAIKRSEHPKSQDDIERLVSILDLSDLMDRLPHQLSGGECQRGAILRALSVNPKVLLMDEPLTGLDLRRKKEVIRYLKIIKHQLTIPIVYVTHSVYEVSQLADHLVLLDEGQVVASDSYTNVLTCLEHSSLFGTDISAVVETKTYRHHPNWSLLQCSLGEQSIWVSCSDGQQHAITRVRIKASDVSICLSEPAQTSIQNVLRGTILTWHKEQGFVLVKIAVEDAVILSKITVRAFEQLELSEGIRVWCLVKSAVIGD